jgi:hypothetical protein
MKSLPNQHARLVRRAANENTTIVATVIPVVLYAGDAHAYHPVETSSA